MIPEGFLLRKYWARRSTFCNDASNTIEFEAAFPLAGPPYSYMRSTRVMKVAGKLSAYSAASSIVGQGTRTGLIGTLNKSCHGLLDTAPKMTLSLGWARSNGVMGPVGSSMHHTKRHE